MARAPVPMAADLFGDIEPTPSARPRDYLPGLVVSLLATLAAANLSIRYGAPLTLMALLIGLALNFLSADRRLTPGLTLAARELLRWAIVLVGMRVTFGQIAALGPQTLVAVILIIAATIGIGAVAARLLGQNSAFGVLAGGSVAICGASAAMALSATLGERRVRQHELTLVLVGISAMSSLAMVLYPAIAHALHLTDRQAGIFFGASIHDVAQALGAGYSYSAGAGETATIVKLARVALLAPVLAVVAMLFPGEGETRRRLAVPWFVLGFFAVAGVNSLGVIPPRVTGLAVDLSSGMLAMSVAATAIRSPLAELVKTGPRPLFVILAATLVAAALALGFAVLGVSAA